MAITKTALKSTYGGKRDNTDKFTAALWDNALQAIDTKFGEVIDELNGGSSSSSSFTVNGTVPTISNGKITLTAGSTYVLKGTLTGQIVIGDTSDVPTNDTYIELDGVYISTASTDNSAIMYLPEKKEMIVTLHKNTVNKILCTNNAAKADSQKGCIYCENNLVIQGNGYLSLKNKGGHGIKASKLKFFGNPHCYANAIHDAFHGNGQIDLFGGVYYVDGANDAFGTRAASGTYGSADYKTAGMIRVFNADIYAYGLQTGGYVLDSKGNGYIFGKFGIHTDAPSNNVLTSTMKIVDPAVFFGGAVQDTTNGGYSTQPTGTVKCYTADDFTTGETTISPNGGTYTLTTAFAKVSGYINGEIVTPIKTTDIKVGGNTYITGGITYTNAKGKICIKNPKDTNYVFVVAGNYSSSSNLAIETSSGAVSIFKGNVSGDEITLTDTKGVIMVNGNLTGKDIYVGTAASADDTKFLGGALLIDGTIKAILNSKFNKGWIHVLKTGVKGVFYADTIDAAGYADIDGSEHVYYHNAKGIVIGEKTVEVEDYIPC